MTTDEIIDTEVIGAAGVLASLVYVGLQIRQNTRWLRQQAFQMGTNEIRSWASNLSGSRENSELFLRGQSDFKSLDATEKLQFTMLIFELCSVWGTYQEYSGEDFLGLRDSADITIKGWIERGWFKGWWAYNEHMFPPKFKAYVAALIDECSLSSNDSTGQVVVDR